MQTIDRPACAPPSPEATDGHSKASAGRSQTLFVGIDVHKDTHTAVGLSPYGEKIFEMTIGNEAEDFISLVEKTKEEAKRTSLVPSFGLEDVHSWGERLSGEYPPGDSHPTFKPLESFSLFFSIKKEFPFLRSILTRN